MSLTIACHTNTYKPVTPNNASNYRANGILSDYIGWTNELLHYLAQLNSTQLKFLGKGSRVAKTNTVHKNIKTNQMIKVNEIKKTIKRTIKTVQ